MTFSKDWTRVKSPAGGRYWHSPAYGLGLVLGATSALASGGDPLAPRKLLPGEIPGEFPLFRVPFSIAGWIPEPQEPLNKFLGSLGIPIQIPAEAFFFGAQAGEEDRWELVFRIKTRSANQARAMVTLFSLARIAIGGGGAVFDAVRPLFANLPEQDGSVLLLRSASMDEKQVALLFNVVSVYSIQ
jgi:hypothetical protein